jgi:hypothetical protein
MLDLLMLVLRFFSPIITDRVREGNEGDEGEANEIEAGFAARHYGRILISKR